MKITIENLGVFQLTEYELADLTIICGKNNTGKTYATYALYGFLDFFRYGFYIPTKNDVLTSLIESSYTSIHLDVSQAAINKHLRDACDMYQKFLPKIFSAQSKYFENAKFSITVDASEIIMPDTYEQSYRTDKNDFLQITKKANEDLLHIRLLVKDGKVEDNSSIRSSLDRIIGNVIKEVIFNNTISESFIASAERTGAVIFKNELNFQKNTLLREVASATEIHIEDIVDKIYNTSYALPVRRNIDFIRNLDSIAKEESVLSKNFPHIIDAFNSIVGGLYKISKDELYYYPDMGGKTTKLTIGESASSVRALLDVFFFLKYVARPGQLLIIDEPELNLHPYSQRRLAQVLAMLVNAGIKIFITTHSDYIIKELNTLLMLDARKTSHSIIEIMEENGYSKQSLISPSQIKMYTSERVLKLLPGRTKRSRIQSLTQAQIDPLFGIDARCFDETINDMNRIQESIIFAKNEQEHS